MPKSVHDFDELLEGLRQQRDLLKLKMHLARAELRDEWEELEKQWQHLTAKSAEARRDAQDVQKNVFAAARLVAEELRRGYERIGRDL